MEMARKTTKFEASDYLDSPEVIAAYITEALETGDSAFIAMAIGDVAKAKGMTSIASETGLTRESLYKSFNGTSMPEFETVRSVLDSLGMKLVVEPKAA
jgi:probable addiction module antidote protein